MKKMISLLLLVVWMIIIFNLSAMNGIASHSESQKVVRSIVENRTVTPTTEVDKFFVNVDAEGVKAQEVKKENEINEMVLKYDEPIRKTAHVFEYFVLILLMMNFIFQIIKSRKVRYYLSGIVLCVLYACLDEFHQIYVAGRTGQIKDVLIDSVGIIVGAVLFFIIQRIINKRKEKVE